MSIGHSYGKDGYCQNSGCDHHREDADYGMCPISDDPKVDIGDALLKIGGLGLSWLAEQLREKKR